MVEFAVFLLEEALIKVVGSLDQVKLEMTEVKPSSSSAVPSIHRLILGTYPTDINLSSVRARSTLTLLVD